MIKNKYKYQSIYSRAKRTAKHFKTNLCIKIKILQNLKKKAKKPSLIFCFKNQERGIRYNV